MAAALREIDAKKAAISDDAVHYAPGDSLLCGEDVVDALCTHEPEAMAGCIPCLELVAEDLTDDNTYMGRCLHRRREIHAQGVSSGAVPCGVLALTVAWQDGEEAGHYHPIPMT